MSENALISKVKGQRGKERVPVWENGFRLIGPNVDLISLVCLSQIKEKYVYIYNFYVFTK